MHPIVMLVKLLSALSLSLSRSTEVTHEFLLIIPALRELRVCSGDVTTIQSTKLQLRDHFDDNTEKVQAFEWA